MIDANYAISCAMDLGLTYDEAETAYSEFNWSIPNMCIDCGCILIDSGNNRNCIDKIDDEYCAKCWNESCAYFTKKLGDKSIMFPINTNTWTQEGGEL